MSVSIERRQVHGGHVSELDQKTACPLKPRLREGRERDEAAAAVEEARREVKAEVDDLVSAPAC